MSRLVSSLIWGVHLALASLPAARVIVADALVRDRIASRPVLPDDLDKPTTPGAPLPGTPSPGGRAAPRRPVIYFYSQPGCAACSRAQSALDAARDLPFDVKPAKPPAWVDAYPTLHWNDASGRGKIVRGWAADMTAAKLVTVWKATQPAPPPPPPERPTTLRSDAVYYGSVPSLYTWPGDLREHLAGAPHHVPRQQLRIMSPRELVATHDAWHVDAARKTPRRSRGLFDWSEGGGFF